MVEGNKSKMFAKSAIGPMSVAACLLVLTLFAAANSQPVDKEKILNELDLVDEDGSIDTALLNFLFNKHLNRLRASQNDMTDLQRKRSYWKQCAFNAVSCFGQKREGGGGRSFAPSQRNGRWDLLLRLFSFKK